ncbi:uncharacterized protein TNCV_3527841 [Trichonephila clavipes]|nr:uncharacterized protein TNCV_3527841 [Trichonephila clavipes]
MQESNHCHADSIAITSMRLLFRQELRETLPVEQDQQIQQPTRETFCSTPLITVPRNRKSAMKRKPNASVKTTEAANARTVASERDTQEMHNLGKKSMELYHDISKIEHFLK